MSEAMAFADGSEISHTIRHAVRHLQDLSESFRTEKFDSDDLSNIDFVADTLIALEKEILKLNSDYETESIDSSRFRHRLKLLPTTIKNEIQTAVQMARESNVSVIQSLQKDLDAQLELVKSYTEQDNQLNAAINALQAEKNALQSQYDATIHEVNARLSDKSTLQINLNETRDTVRETNQDTFDLEEDMMALKERLMQERNDARQEKNRLEDEANATLKRFNEQERANQSLKKDVDLATHQVSESELQLRSMYRERERFENDNAELKKKIDEQNEFYQMEVKERDQLLKDQLLFAETCGTNLLDFQMKKSSLEERGAMAVERTDEETENLKRLKEKHDVLLKRIEEEINALKLVESTVTDTGKELEDIKQDIAGKLEKTAQLNLENARTTEELEAMKEAHQMMIDSLKLQMNTLDKELQHIRDTRITKQKEREVLLKQIEQTKLTSRNNEIRHNRFVSQTTSRVNDLSERKVILDRNAREDALQSKQLDERLTKLRFDYAEMKKTFEEQIEQLQKNTDKLLKSIESNRKKIDEETPEFNRLTDQHQQTSNAYESTKETMIETKRKKQEILDKIATIEKSIRDKNRSRDLTMVAVKESQRDGHERLQRTHEQTMKLEEDIYEKGCRLETIEQENEHFQQTIDYLQHQIDLFTRFSEQSSNDIKHLDHNNHHLLEILESGWQDDRLLENQSAQQDLAYIDVLTELLKKTEKRKAKVGTVVYRLIGELQQLKYYLEGMSNPPTPALPRSSPDRRRTGRSVSRERSQSALSTSPSPRETRPRPNSSARAEVSVATPYPMTKDVQERVSHFVEDHFHIRPNSTGKPSALKSSKTQQTNSDRKSARTDYSSWKSMLTSEPPSRPTTTLKVAFAE